MTDDIDAMLHREPFVPFQIVLTSGSTYVVRSPYQLVPEPAKLNYYHFGSDRKAVLRLNQLAALETLAE